MIPGSANSLLLASAAAAGGYQVSRSLRFNSSDSGFCSRTPAVAGNRKTWTWAAWVKRSALSSGQLIVFQTGTTSVSTGTTRICFQNNSLDIRLDGNNSGQRATSAVYRDVSAWMHIVLSVDTTQATAVNRIGLYVNGDQVAAFSTSSDTSQNFDTAVNTTTAHRLGAGVDSGGGLASYFDGYLADIHFIDGQALTPSSFTEVSATTGQLIPLAYSGTFGTNGFWLKFSDNSAATAATLGKDYSGNSNNWTPNNFSVAATAYTTANSITSSGGLSNASRILDGTASADATIASGAAYIEFNPPGGISYTTSVEVMGAGSPSSPYNTRWQLNNGSLVNAINANSWVSLASGSGTITEIRLQCDTGGLNWRGIRVDGVILKEDAGPGIDSLVDTPTSYGTDTGVGGEVRGNYATLNPLSGSSTHPLANGNLEKVSTSGSGNRFGTVGITSGKFYWENAFTTFVSLGSCGISSNGRDANNISELKIYESYGTKYNGSSSSSYGASWGVNDVIGIAFDADNGTLAFYKNGVSQGTAFTGLTGLTWFPVFRDDGGNTGFINFGQRAFTYTAPSGFKALCDTNIPEGTITTSGTFTGNASADGPFVYLNGVPTAMTINSNAVTFATHADKLSNGFKLRTSSGSYNTAGSNSYSITTTGAKFKYARAQPNP